MSLRISRLLIGSFLCVGLLLSVVDGYSQLIAPQVDSQMLSNGTPYRPSSAPVSQETEQLPFAPWSPHDDDIGQQLILKDTEKYKMFTLFADATGYWTNNVALTSRGEREDYYAVGQVGANLQPKFTDNLIGEVTVRQQFYRYDTFDGLDFDSLNAGAGLTYASQFLGGIAVFSRYNYNRLTDTRQHNEFYSTHTILAGVQKPFVLSKAHFLYIGLTGEVALHTEPSISRRHAYTLYAGYSVDLTRSINAQAYYKAIYYDYRADRHDITQVVGIGASYNPTEWFSVLATGTFAFNNSNYSVFDYDAANLGAGLAVNFKF